MNRFSYQLLTLIAVVFLVAASVEAQTGRASVTMKGTVSGTVALSVPPDSSGINGDINVESSGSTVLMTLSGTDVESPVIRVPLIVRSNSRFNIWAVVQATKGQLSQLSVIDVRANGSLVSPEAVSGLDIPQQFDLRVLNENASATSLLPLDVTSPFRVLTGPRVSLGGTPDSPNNALQITLLIRVKPHPREGWLLNLKFAGSADTL